MIQQNLRKYASTAIFLDISHCYTNPPRAILAQNSISVYLVYFLKLIKKVYVKSSSSLEQMTNNLKMNKAFVRTRKL